MSAPPLTRKQKILLAVGGIGAIGVGVYLLTRKPTEGVEPYAPTPEFKITTEPEEIPPLFEPWEPFTFPTPTPYGDPYGGLGGFGLGGTEAGGLLSGLSQAGTLPDQPYTPPTTEQSQELSTFGKLFGYGVLGLVGLAGLGVAKKLGITGLISSGASAIKGALTSIGSALGITKAAILGGPILPLTGAVALAHVAPEVVPQVKEQWAYQLFGGYQPTTPTWYKAIGPVISALATPVMAPIQIATQAIQKYQQSQPTTSTAPSPPLATSFSTFLQNIPSIVSKISIPQISLPQISLPKITLPSFQMPSITSLFKTPTPTVVSPPIVTSVAPFQMTTAVE